MKCPTCQRRIEWENNPFRPFCSERCKLVDLGRWMSEEYRVPGKETVADKSDDNDNQRTSELSE